MFTFRWNIFFGASFLLKLVSTVLIVENQFQSELWENSGIKYLLRAKAPWSMFALFTGGI